MEADVVILKSRSDHGLLVDITSVSTIGSQDVDRKLGEGVFNFWSLDYETYDWFKKPMNSLLLQTIIKYFSGPRKQPKLANVICDMP